MTCNDDCDVRRTADGAALGTPRRLAHAVISLVLAGSGAGDLALAQGAPTDTPSLQELEKALDAKQAARQRAAEEKGRAERAAKVAEAAGRSLTCSDKRNEPNAIKFHGVVTYESASRRAGETVSWTLTWNVLNTGSGGHSGSLRATLFAVQDDEVSSEGWSGYKIGNFVPDFQGKGAFSSNQIEGGWSWDNMKTVIKAKNPPIGKYCMVAFIEEYDSDDCTASDHYCLQAWTKFPDAELFQ